MPFYSILFHFIPFYSKNNLYFIPKKTYKYQVFFLELTKKTKKQKKMKITCQIIDFAQENFEIQVNENDSMFTLKTEIRKLMKNHAIHPVDIKDDIKDIQFHVQDSLVTTDVELIGFQNEIIKVTIVDINRKRVRRPTEGLDQRPACRIRIEERNITLGHLVKGRELDEMDHMKVNLNQHSENSNNDRNIYLVQKLWACMTDTTENEWILEQNNNGTPCFTFVTDTKCITSTRKRENNQDNSINVIIGETQIGKSLDIAVLSWFFQKLGFLVVVLVRNNGGADSITTLKKGMENIKKTAIRMIEQECEASNDDKRFLETLVFGRNLSCNDEDTRIGDLQKGGFIIADLQNATFCRDLSAVISKCLDGQDFPLCCIADEGNHFFNLF
jgi:hypothetical protein